MEIIIKGEPEEIAALVLPVQERQWKSIELKPVAILETEDDKDRLIQRLNERIHELMQFHPM